MKKLILLAAVLLLSQLAPRFSTVMNRYRIG